MFLQFHSLLSFEIYLMLIIAIVNFIRKIRSKKEKEKEFEKDEIPKKEFITPHIVNDKVETIEKKTEDLKDTKKEKPPIKFDEVQKSTKKVGVQTIVVEHEERKDDIIKTPPIPRKKEALTIPVKIREQIEKTILLILYKERSVKSLKLLIDKVLEQAVDEKITVSEKMISLIVSQMNKDDKIQFTQKEGWKIKI